MRWFTADTHFGHGLSFRDFPNIEAHDDALIDGINKNVGRTDELYIVGDFGCGTLGAAARADGKQRSVGYFRQRIKCRHVHLILGNHDLRKHCDGHFTTIRDKLEIKVPYIRGPSHVEPYPTGRIKIYLDHYPSVYWPSSHYGSLHLYGHVHSRREATLDGYFPNRRSMDCGVDNAYQLTAAYRPFADFEIIDRLMSRSGHDPVSFYR